MDQQDTRVRRRPAPAKSEHIPEPRATEIRAEIEETRAEMGETIEAIQDRLHPGNIVSRAASTVRDATVEKVRHMTGRSWDDGTPRRAADWYYGDGILDRIREHPVPAALAAASLAWLAFAKRPQRDYVGPPYNMRPERESRYGVSDEGEWEGDANRGIDSQRGVPGWESGPRSGAVSRIKGVGQETRLGMQRMARQNTLSAGLIAAGIGVAIGFVLPETNRENELLGEARDSMVDRGKSAAKDAAQKVQDTAKKVASEALHPTSGNAEPGE
jgi:Protein of unknown function (DUF3618)